MYELESIYRVSNRSNYTRVTRDIILDIWEKVALQVFSKYGEKSSKEIFKKW